MVAPDCDAVVPRMVPLVETSEKVVLLVCDCVQMVKPGGKDRKQVPVLLWWLTEMLGKYDMVTLCVQNI